MSWNSNWEEVFKNKEWGRYPAEELVRFIARNYFKYKNRDIIKVLDLGCGIGSNLWFLAKEGFSIYGIDGSKSAVEQCKKRLDKEIPKWSGDLKVGDIVKLPYENETFDCVIDNCTVTSNSFENSLKIYSEAYRVLQKGGKLYSRTFATGTHTAWGSKTSKEKDQMSDLVSIKVQNDIDKAHRHTSYEEIYILMKSFSNFEIEKLVRTFDNMQKEVIEWLIVCQK